MSAPWAKPDLVNAALQLACAVRDDNPDDVTAELLAIGTGELANVAVVLAAMVDVDQPLSALRRWASPRFVGRREVEKVDEDPTGYPLCRKERHPMVPSNVRISEGGKSVRRCRACDRERKQKYWAAIRARNAARTLRVAS